MFSCHFLLIFTHSSWGADPVSSPCWRPESLKWPWRNSPSPRSSQEHHVHVCKICPGYPQHPRRVSAPHQHKYSDHGCIRVSSEMFFLNMYSLKGLSAWHFPRTCGDDDGIHISQSQNVPNLITDDWQNTRISAYRDGFILSLKRNARLACTNTIERYRSPATQSFLRFCSNVLESRHLSAITVLQ